MGNLPANMKKNRVLQIIPCEFKKIKTLQTNLKVAVKHL